MTSDTVSENKSEKKSQSSFLVRFLKIWGIVTIAGIAPFVFQFGLLRIWIFLLIGAGISLFLALILPLFYKRAAAQDIPRIQEWRQTGNISELIKYLNTHAADSFSPVWNEAVKAVIEMGPSIVPNLIEALSTETPYVPTKNEAASNFLLNVLRVNMAYCLGEIGDQSAIPALKSTLRKYRRKNAYQDKLVKAQVEDALAKLGVSKEEIEQIKKEKIVNGLPSVVGPSELPETSSVVPVSSEEQITVDTVRDRIAAGLCPKCGKPVAPSDQNCPSCRINLAWARQNPEQLANRK